MGVDHGRLQAGVPKETGAAINAADSQTWAERYQKANGPVEDSGVNDRYDSLPDASLVAKARNLGKKLIGPKWPTNWQKYLH
jgi:hypothetical protein